MDSKRVKEGIELCHEIKEKIESQPSSYSLSSIFKNSIQANTSAETLDLLLTFKNLFNFIPDSELIFPLFSKSISNFDKDTAEAILSIAKEYKMELSGYYRGVIKLLSNFKDYNKSIELLEEYLNNHDEIDNYIPGSLIIDLIQQHEIDKSIKLLEYCKKMNIQPHHTVFTAFISYFIKNSQFNQAREMVERLYNHFQFQPDLSIFRSFISNVNKNSDFHHLISFISYLFDFGLIKTSQIYHQLIELSISYKQSNYGIILLEQMRANHILPELNSVEILFNKFIKEEDCASAKFVMNYLISINYRISKPQITHFVQLAINKVELSMAWECLMEFKNKETSLSNPMLNQLLEKLLLATVRIGDALHFQKILRFYLDNYPTVLFPHDSLIRLHFFDYLLKNFHFLVSLEFIHFVFHSDRAWDRLCHSLIKYNYLFFLKFIHFTLNSPDTISLLSNTTFPSYHVFSHSPSSPFSTFSLSDGSFHFIPAPLSSKSSPTPRAVPSAVAPPKYIKDYSISPLTFSTFFSECWNNYDFNSAFSVYYHLKYVLTPVLATSPSPPSFNSPFFYSYDRVRFSWETLLLNTAKLNKFYLTENIYLCLEELKISLKSPAVPPHRSKQNNSPAGTNARSIAQENAIHLAILSSPIDQHNFETVLKFVNETIINKEYYPVSIPSSYFPFFIRLFNYALGSNKDAFLKHAAELFDRMLKLFPDITVNLFSQFSPQQNEILSRFLPPTLIASLKLLIPDPTPVAPPPPQKRKRSPPKNAKF